MYIDIHMYLHTHIYIYIDTHMYVQVCIYIYIYGTYFGLFGATGVYKESGDIQPGRGTSPLQDSVGRFGDHVALETEQLPLGCTWPAILAV